MVCQFLVQRIRPVAPLTWLLQSQKESTRVLWSSCVINVLALFNSKLVTLASYCQFAKWQFIRFRSAVYYYGIHSSNLLHSFSWIVLIYWNGPGRMREKIGLKPSNSIPTAHDQWTVIQSPESCYGEKYQK
jgi:hypothetical protein